MVAERARLHTARSGVKASAMTQSLERVQHQLTGVQQTLAILIDKVEVLDAAAAAAAMEDPSDRVVRLDFMNLSIDSNFETPVQLMVQLHVRPY